MNKLLNLQKLSMDQLEDMMLNHFRNMKQWGQMSVPENQNFFKAYMYWTCKLNNMAERAVSVNFIIDKKLEGNDAYVCWVADNAFHVYIDRKYCTSVDPVVYAYTVILAGHEIRHVQQSLTTPSWEDSLKILESEIKDLRRYNNKDNEKQSKKLLARLTDTLVYNHRVEKDARDASFNYAIKMFKNLIAKAEDDLKPYLEEILESVKQRQVGEKRAEVKNKQYIKRDCKLAERLGLNPNSLRY